MATKPPVNTVSYKNLHQRFPFLVNTGFATTLVPELTAKKNRNHRGTWRSGARTPQIESHHFLDLFLDMTLAASTALFQTYRSWNFQHVMEYVMEYVMTYSKSMPTVKRILQPCLLMFHFPHQ